MRIPEKNCPAEAFSDCGAKAYHLAQMVEWGFSVPPFICIEPADTEDDITAALQRTGIQPLYAVRSSSAREDGEAASYAGQFVTFLSVPPEEVCLRIKECFSGESRLAYPGRAADKRGTEWVIVQQMIPSDLSGVLFTQNPLGIISESVITVGAGVGSNVVEDKTPTTTYYHNHPDGKSYHVKQEGAPELSEELRRELTDDGKRLENYLGEGLDIEFAVFQRKLYLLQARKITTLSHDKRLTLDSSNIVESYPGLTCPLTADFVSRQYTAIFKGVVTRLSGSDFIARQYGEGFDHMVECYNGRMYYHLDHWYAVIGLLPFSHRILPLWREMLGVRQEEATFSPYRLSAIRKLSIVGHTIYYFFCAPRKMNQLKDSMQRVESAYSALKTRKVLLTELQEFYEHMVSLVMDKWDYTLINDMYTFLHTGLYRRTAPKGEGDIDDISYLASLQPVRELMDLALLWKQSGDSEEYKEKVSHYIERYGDRSIGELKLETETFRERPDRLQAQIEQYANMPKLTEVIKQLSGDGEKKRRRGIPGFFLSRAKRGIENRERSRMDRTRLFGIARWVFLQAGEILCAQGRIAQPRDVFYLTIDEVFSENGVYSELVQERKRHKDSYEQYPAYERVIFDGEVVQKPCLTRAVQQEVKKGALLSGTPCSGGKARGPALLVENPQLAGDVTGKILVTHSTDPGWAFLMASAGGLISEKGSLLSHTAIIARELHVPIIVAVEGALSAIKNGDIVEMNCDTGVITLLKNEEEPEPKEE